MKQKQTSLELTFINVGYGEAILLTYRPADPETAPYRILIDGGSAEASEYEAFGNANASKLEAAGNAKASELDGAVGTGRIRTANFLKQKGITRLDLMIPTHIHEDHICGLQEAAKSAPPRQVLQCLPKDFYQTMYPLATEAIHILETGDLIDLKPSDLLFRKALNSYLRFCKDMHQLVIPVNQVFAGDQYTPVPGLAVHILGPIPEKQQMLIKEMHGIYDCTDSVRRHEKLRALDARMNNYSLILRIDFGQTRILLPGDTNWCGYSGIASEKLHADLFKIGHHGQKDGADAKLIETIAPQATICCASSDRRYQSADPGVLQMVAAHGSKLYFSDCPTFESDVGILSAADGKPIPKHSATTFTIFENGNIHAEYS